jgi:hypothetical protein
MTTLRKVMFRLLNAITLLLAIVVGIPALMIVAFFIFVAIGEQTGRPTDYFTSSDH